MNLRHRQTIAAQDAAAAYSFRLRDVRRLLARPHALRSHELRGAVVSLLEEACRVVLGETFSPWDIAYRPDQLELARRLTDRLISRRGADALLAELVPARLEQYLRELGEERPKLTDEVAELATGTSASAHGGDGNSGEVDSLAETRSEEVRHDLTGSPQPGWPESGSGCTAPSARGPETPGDPASSEAAAAGSERAGDEPSAGQAAGRTGRESQPAGQDAAEGGSADLGGGNEDREPVGTRAEGDGHPNRGQTPAAESGSVAAGGGTGTDRSPAQPSCAAGLDEARLRALEEADALRRSAADVVRHLRRLLLEASGSGSPSPRIDGRRLAREMVSRRLRLAAARRRELDYGDLVIAVDESGSCQSVVGATLPAALAIAREIGARAILIEHFNGDIDMQADSIADWPAWLRRALVDRARGEWRSDSVWRAVVRRRPRLVLALGDFDSHEQFESMAQAGQRLVLLTHLRQEWFASVPQTSYQVLWGISDIHSAARVLLAAKIQKGRNDRCGTS